MEDSKNRVQLFYVVQLLPEAGLTGDSALCHDREFMASIYPCGVGHTRRSRVLALFM